MGASETETEADTGAIDGDDGVLRVVVGVLVLGLVLAYAVLVGRIFQVLVVLWGIGVLYYLRRIAVAVEGTADG